MLLTYLEHRQIQPVYLTIGNDLGALTAKVIIALGADGKINAIAGFIYVDRETGEFTAHLSDGTVFLIHNILI
jgi:hypothetical protein